MLIRCIELYVKALNDMIDFRKANGISDTTLRCFTVTEVYLRREKENLRKRKNLECTRNLNLETLIAKDSWCRDLRYLKNSIFVATFVTLCGVCVCWYDSSIKFDTLHFGYHFEIGHP